MNHDEDGRLIGISQMTIQYVVSRTRVCRCWKNLSARNARAEMKGRKRKEQNHDGHSTDDCNGPSHDSGGNGSPDLASSQTARQDGEQVDSVSNNSEYRREKADCNQKG